MESRSPSRVRFYTILTLMALTSLILLSQIFDLHTSALSTMFPGRPEQKQQPQNNSSTGSDADPQDTGTGIPTFRNYSSLHSFDVDASPGLPDWMARLPDSAPLSRLSIPGTHDTLTHRIADIGYQCQNHPLATQLRAGVRYLDVRLRLNAAGDLLVYHAGAYTGYTFPDVLLTAFAFLDDRPSEALVVRVKEEGPPVRNDDPDRFPPVPAVSLLLEEEGGGEGNQATKPARTFEQAFEYYRLEDPRTAPGAARHMFLAGDRDGAAGSGSRPSLAREMPIPTLGELRGKMMILQEFPSPARGGPYGIPWASDQLRIEDYWIIINATYLDDKWAAVRENLAAAAASARNESDGRMYISHLSAAVGVLPIEAAAGPLEDRAIAGMNDRTGEWLVEKKKGTAGGLTGIVIADFPGRRLLEAIVAHNEWLVPKVRGRSRWFRL